MAKTYIDTVKYLIYTQVEIDGLVEKPDVVGAIFGQTEGLLGDELDLRDLQKNGRIGRIEVDLDGKDGRTSGTIKIPSSLDMVETCIIAAALETVDRVGPCEARLKIGKVEDTRSLKRKVMVERAKALLKNLLNTEIPESKEISELVRDEVKTAEIVEYGQDRLAAGPMVDKSEEVVFVEGRADVINLLKNDIANVVAIGGARITKTIVELSKKKEVTIFLDGDRGGDIILNELVQSNVDIDFIARAPTGMEVEELTRKEIIKYIRNRVPFEQGVNKKALERRTREVPKFRQTAEQIEEKERRVEAEHAQVIIPPLHQKREKKEDFSLDIELEKDHAPAPKAPRAVVEEPKVEKFEPLEKDDLVKELAQLANTLKARFYNEKLERVGEVQVRDVIKSLSDARGIHAIVFDGIITQRLADLASKQGVKIIVGIKTGNVNKVPDNIEIITKAK
jgi:DNA primase